MLSYIAYFKPIYSSLLNITEILNEICVLCTGYFILSLSDFHSDVEMKELIGLVLVGFMSLNIASNTTLVVVSTVTIIKDKVKKWI